MKHYPIVLSAALALAGCSGEKATGPAAGLSGETGLAAAHVCHVRAYHLYTIFNAISAVVTRPAALEAAQRGKSHFGVLMTTYGEKEDALVKSLGWDDAKRDALFTQKEKENGLAPAGAKMDIPADNFDAWQSLESTTRKECPG